MVMESRAEENDRLLALEDRLRVLEAENERLAEQAEETLLLRLIAEAVSRTDDRSELLASLLEKLSILKDIPFCACCALVEEEVHPLAVYAASARSSGDAVTIRITQALLERLDDGPLVLSGGVGAEAGISIESAGDAIVPQTVALLPFQVRSVHRGLFLFVDGGDGDRLTPMLQLLQQVVALAVVKMDQIALLEELHEITSELEQRVEERTRELNEANEQLQSEIRERREAEERLRRERTQIEGLFQASPGAIALVDDRGRAIRVNEGFTRLFGYRQEELAGKPLDEALVPPDARKEARSLTDLVSTGERISVEAVRQTKDGRRLHVSILGAPFTMADGQVVAYAIYQDITEQKQAERELRESERKFRDLSEKSLVGVYLIQDSVFKYVNPCLASVFGYTVEEVTGKLGPADLTLPEDRPVVKENIRKRLSGEQESINYTFHGLRKNGDIIHIEVHGARTTFEGRPAIIGTLLDVTAQKELEAQLRQSQKMEAVGRLAGGVAHDFNNLLTVILGYSSQILSQLDEGDPLYRKLEMIRSAGEKAEALTRQLLVYSRRQPLQLRTTDLNDLLRNLDRMLARVIGEDVELELRPCDAPATVKVDPAQFEQVIMNLAVNARDAMPSGGRLSIITRCIQIEDDAGKVDHGMAPGDYVLVELTDTGVGMDRSIQERIFEPFFTTKGRGEGTGLGLSTVYGIVDRSGGRIHVQSEPGAGTTFKIYLPRVKAAGNEVERADRVPSSLHGEETVFVVEDDEEVRSYIRSALEHFGYTVVEAASAEEALARFGEGREESHVLVTDVILPGMDGVGLATKILERAPAIPVLFVSGYPADRFEARSADLEEVNLLQKPFTAVDLARRIRALLD